MGGMKCMGSIYGDVELLLLLLLLSFVCVVVGGAISGVLTTLTWSGLFSFE